MICHQNGFILGWLDYSNGVTALYELLVSSVLKQKLVKWGAVIWSSRIVASSLHKDIRMKFQLLYVVQSQLSRGDVVFYSNIKLSLCASQFYHSSELSGNAILSHARNLAFQPSSGLINLDSILMMIFNFIKKNNTYQTLSPFTVSIFKLNNLLNGTVFVST